MFIVPIPSMTESRDEASRADVDRKEHFLQLFLANERRIYSYILALIPVWSDADDLLQETSAVLWRKLDEYRPGTDFLAWALRIARYEVYNFRRNRSRDRSLFCDQTAEILADQASTSGRSSDDLRDALEACLAKLNERDRELVRLRYQPGATTQDVARYVGRSHKAVYKALNRIHDQLLMCIRRGMASRGSS